MEQQLCNILENIGDAVIETDREGWITFMNDVAENLTGWQTEEALGKKLAEVLIVKDAELNNFDKQWLSRVIGRELNKSSQYH